MRIRFILFNAYLGGGTVRTVFNTAGLLAARGHEIEVVSVYRHREKTRFPVPPGVVLRVLTGQAFDTGWRGGPAAVARRVGQGALRRLPSVVTPREESRSRQYNAAGDLALRRYLRSVHDGVVVTTRSGLNLALARWARPGVITVAQEHLHLRAHSEGLQRRFRDSYGRLDALVTLTERDRDQYRELLGPDARIVAVPNAVAVEHDGPALSRHDNVAVAAGRLSRQKGFDLLIRAWRRVGEQHPDWKLHIFGSGPRHDRLQARIDKLGLGDRVQLMGFTEELEEELSRAALFILSSRFEGLPMVLIEAMNLGTPVVAFDCPTGPAELVEDGVTGLLVEPLKVKALAGAINRAIEDPELRAAMGKAGQQRVRELNPGAVADHWERLLEELFAAHSAGLRGIGDESVSVDP
ncbi:MAG TPA: glycosyltransferase family 4 protein [Marmoricola sp.]|nr:glycosyltransferase family 4 protein [Marmoricola sp.]